MKPHNPIGPTIAIRAMSGRWVSLITLVPVIARERINGFSGVSPKGRDPRVGRTADGIPPFAVWS